MPSIRQLRERIKSVKNIQQITRAMKMVASARLRRAQKQLLETRPYAGRITTIIEHIAECPEEAAHPLLSTNEAGRSALVVLTSDKGLCAGFNAQLLQKAGGSLLAQSGSSGIELLVLGRKGIDFFRRNRIKPFREWAGFWQELSWHHADLVGQELIDAYSAKRWRQVTLVYNQFKSALIQEVVEQRLLPVQDLRGGKQKADTLRDYEFEPSAPEIYALLLPRYVKMSIWRALLESKAAELAARMQAMGNATDSAGEMIADVTLQMNRARQAGITREISELVGSAEAVNI
ncbi:ATP synthase F1 subunit gamma [candidate division FCPU426 bacterium]|nr:ATP synthase F1 subunit gamma [candidate division FCPU426 bacterium]